MDSRRAWSTLKAMKLELIATCIKNNIFGRKLIIVTMTNIYKNNVPSQTSYVHP